jgi:hypothetical protein
VWYSVFALAFMARSKQARPIGRPRQDAAARGGGGGGGRGEVAGRIPRLLKRKRRMRPGTSKIYPFCILCPPFCVPVVCGLGNAKAMPCFACTRRISCVLHPLPDPHFARVL